MKKMVENEKSENSAGGQLDIPSLSENVARSLERVNKEILQRFESKKTRPDVVLVLERSAVLPASSVTKRILHNDPQTQILAIPVGKVIPYMFVEHKMSQDDDFDEIDLDLSDPKQAAEFMVWFKNCKDPTIKNLRSTLKKLRLRRKKILVIDDARASGETIDSTLPLVLQAVYTRPIDFDSTTYFEGSFSWEKEITAQLGISLTPAEAKLMSTVVKGSFDLRRFKIELESGFYDSLVQHSRHISQMKAVVRRQYKNGTTGIVSLDSPIFLKMAGYQALLQLKSLGKSDETVNPAYRLLNEYGIESLQELAKKAKNVFERMNE